MGRFFKYLIPVLLGLSLGFLRVVLAEHQVTPSDIDYYNGQTMEVIGVITEVDIRRDKAKYTVSAEGDYEGDVLISLNKYPQYKYGDRVRLWGEILAPGSFDGFDYGAYLSRFGVYSVMYHPSVKLIESGQGNFFWHGMSYLQGKFMERINRLFPEPHASFEAGLLVGARKGMTF